MHEAGKPPYGRIEDRLEAPREAAFEFRRIAHPPERHARLTWLLEGQPWRAARYVSDAALLVLAVLLAFALGPRDPDMPLLVVFPPLASALLYARGRYRQRVLDVATDNIAQGFGAISIAAMSVFVLTSLVHGTDSDRSMLVTTTWLASLVGVTVGGSLLTTIQYLARRRRLVYSRTLIVGADATGRDIARRLTEHPEYGLYPVGFLDTAIDGGEPVLGGLDDLGEAATKMGVGHVILAFPDASHRELLALIKRCDELSLETMVLPRLSGSINHQTQFEYLGTLPLLNLRAIDPDGWRFAIKYMIDRVVAGIFLLALSPLLLIIALAVKLSSPGPIFFRQLRAGRDGRLFELFKFRTMVAPVGEVDEFSLVGGLAPGGVEGADRRTRVGRLLRRSSLDELPQLLNVMRGEMSLVGPRPERPEFAELFRQSHERYHDRHRVRSGITGWAQVHGFRGQTPLADRVEFDNFYIEHWSLALDIKILLLTLPALLKGS
ncbi:MAG: exopolysaccharide biosynthesis polyprenyl glycosylphosphotransferase [Solirubrobacteraceae bacterium]